MYTNLKIYYLFFPNFCRYLTKLSNQLLTIVFIKYV